MRDFKSGFAQRVTRRVGFHRGEGEGGLSLRSLQGCGKGELFGVIGSFSSPAVLLL